MVTHISSLTSSDASLPMTSRSNISHRAPPISYAASQAGSESLSRRPAPSSTHQNRSRHHSRIPSASSSDASSQSTLVPSQSASVGAYPTTRSDVSFGGPPSAYKAPSVASTSAARPRHSHRLGRLSRSRRSSREVEPVEQNSFPWFGQTGDVEIHIWDRRRRTEKRWLLHRLILAQNSRRFAKDVAKASKGQSATTAASGGPLVGGPAGMAYNPAAYRPNTVSTQQTGTLSYEVDWTSFVDSQNRMPVLVLRNAEDPSQHTAGRPPNVSRSKPPPLSPGFSRDPTSGSGRSMTDVQQSEDVDVFTAYDQLFMTFYNHMPKFSNDNIASAYVDSKLLLSLAAYYDSIDTVGPRIDYHLLQFGSRLWKQIAKYPPSYLKLGYAARSKAIFSEALTHVVGAWPAGQGQLRRGMPGVYDTMIDLIEDKADEMEDMKLRAEAKLFRLSLTTGRGERVGPANGFTDWLALSLFRQWVADNTAQAQSGILKDSGNSSGRPLPATLPKLVRTYRLLAAGGQNYLGHDECKRFLKLRPENYSREALRRFERRIDELKHLASEAVRPLTRNTLQLDMSHGEVPYLCCTRFEERDAAYVWNNNES